MRHWVIALLIALMHVDGSSAEIYRWTDENGKLHFTQLLDQVPSRYREQALGQQPAKRAGSFQTYVNSVEQRARVTGRNYRIRFEREGSLMRVDALVNDHQEIPFLIDTGASSVSIPASTARQLGIVVGPDTPRITVRTANGLLQVPLVRLDAVSLGGARVEGLMATVNPTMNIGLLGGAFFNHFTYAVDPAASVITLERNHAVVSGLGEDHWRRRFRGLRESISELEAYLESHDGLHQGRQEELEQKRTELRGQLDALSVEANRDNIPIAWRH
jgi:clan AA aspartic protease (TIGR02281 family)